MSGPTPDDSSFSDTLRSERRDNTPSLPPALILRCPRCLKPLPVAEHAKTGCIACPSCGQVDLATDAPAIEPGHPSTENGCGNVATGSPTRPAAMTAAAGQMLGRFQLMERLGEGGFGTVWKAQDSQLGRLVALKIILTGPQPSSTEMSRFRREAEAVARLQHPNIVQIYDVGEQDGRPYLALELVSGGSLAGRLDGTPLANQRAAELSLTLARAVQHAHERGILHRDLKPANVLLTADGTAKLSDFGLAKRIDTEGDETKTGTVMGTPCYMAPEQAWGHVHDLGPAADIYALGAMLYELLTGRPPFKGASALETLDQVRSHEPVPPTALQPKLPQDLETICLKCLQKEPQDRYASAAALAHDLECFLAGEPISARSLTVVERMARTVSFSSPSAAVLRPWSNFLMAMACVPLIVQGTLFLLFGRQPYYPFSPSLSL